MDVEQFKECFEVYTGSQHQPVKVFGGGTSNFEQNKIMLTWVTIIFHTLFNKPKT